MQSRMGTELIRRTAFSPQRIYIPNKHGNTQCSATKESRPQQTRDTQCSLRCGRRAKKTKGTILTLRLMQAASHCMLQAASHCMSNTQLLHDLVVGIPSLTNDGSQEMQRAQQPNTRVSHRTNVTPAHQVNTTSAMNIKSTGY